MAKYILQTLEGEDLATKSKKDAAIKVATDQGLVRFRVVTDKGTVVYEQVPETVEETVEEPEKIDEPETLYYEFLDFPGNYSLVMAPFAVEIAEAAGVPAKVETFKGKLTKRVHFGGTDMDLTSRVVSLVQEEAAAAHEHLKQWQKDNIEKRRGLTDMQKYRQHRDVLAEHGHKVARQVKKNGV